MLGRLKESFYHRRLLRERLAAQSKIPNEEILLSIMRGLEKRAAWCVKIIQTDVLLINMCGPWEANGQRPKTGYSGVLGGYSQKYGGNDPDIGFTYAPLDWSELSAIAIHYFELHPQISNARKRLHGAGIATRWAMDAYNAASELNLCYELNDSTILSIRRLAKVDCGAVENERSVEFDRLFNIYLKQHWGDDAVRKEWREKEPLVEWLPPMFQNLALASNPSAI